MDSDKQFNAKEVGLRVKKRAKELGYTGDSLAEEMNVEYVTISRIYRGLSVIMNMIYIPHLKWGPRQSRSVT